MKQKRVKKTVILSILFFLPVMFLLFLYPSKHNYIPLDIINEGVTEVSIEEKTKLEGHLTVLAFFGKKPMEKALPAANLKELIYDKFKGFKKFQVVVIVPQASETEVKTLKKEIERYEDLKFWHYVYHNDEDIKRIYSSLKRKGSLDTNFATDEVFIIDKDLNQRGRLDDRTEREAEANNPIYDLSSYNCIRVAELKNKMSEDMRILFTEYRQKRKGNFDSSIRRADDLKTDEQKN